MKAMRLADFRRAFRLSWKKALRGLEQTTGTAGGYDFCRTDRPIQFNFNPRGPCGPRLSGSAGGTICPGFQSTRPMRASTLWNFAGETSLWIFQSTRPMRASTANIPKFRILHADFFVKTSKNEKFTNVIYQNFLL